MDKKRTKNRPNSVHKIGAILATVVHLGTRSMEFFGMDIHPNNICTMNKGQKLRLKDTRAPTCARMCVRARVGTCVCACARVRARVCVRA